MSDGNPKEPFQDLVGRSLTDPVLESYWRGRGQKPIVLESLPPGQTADRGSRPGGHWKNEPAPGSLADWVRVNRTLRQEQVEKVPADKLTSEDAKYLEMPRCGLWRVTRGLVPPSLEGRLERLEWLQHSEVGWKKRKLILAIKPGGLPFKVSQAYFDNSVDRAVTSWNHADIGIEIRRMAAPTSPDILVQWTSPDDDPHDLLSEQVLAHADYPEANMHLVSSPPLPICLNKKHLWANEASVGSEISARHDIESFVLHELGHCLGLFHKSESSVMFEIVKTGRHRALDRESIDAAKKLYQAEPEHLA